MQLPKQIGAPQDAAHHEAKARVGEEDGKQPSDRGEAEEGVESVVAAVVIVNVHGRAGLGPDARVLQAMADLVCQDEGDGYGQQVRRPKPLPVRELAPEEQEDGEENVSLKPQIIVSLLQRPGRPWSMFVRHSLPGSCLVCHELHQVGQDRHGEHQGESVAGGPGACSGRDANDASEEHGPAARSD